ncbi:hypothetical protein TWF696_001508 [Orbilia brochopaga]|uniref:VWFA domain-containing protein n=1 Tax=Orbilia brochopaga TaxID=3140254 RepID=A0AAV9U8V7_9PEZI
MANTDVTMSNTDAPPPYEEPAGMSVSITEHGASNFLVSVRPPREPPKAEKAKNGFKRAPVDLCCVIDVSGSMEEDAPAPAESAGKAKEETGLTILDVVKHAMKTIIATLNENDRLAIVAFDSRAELISDFQHSSDSGKTLLNTAVDKLIPKASTNLWDGLKMGLNLIHDVQHKAEGSSTSAKKVDSGRLASLFILTDGQPNVEPPRGHIPMLQQWQESHPDTRFAINTFGFGYDLDSALMSNIARTGGGHYGFIPDAGMVGTVFVHALANLFATYATACHVDVELPDGAKMMKPIGEFPHEEASWGAKVYIGDIQYGQSRDFIFQVEGLNRSTPTDIIVTLSAKPWDVQETMKIGATTTTSPELNVPTQDFEYHLQRLTLVSHIYTLCGLKPNEVVGKLNDYKGIFTSQASAIKSSLAGHAAAEALATDISGEVTLAVSDQTAYQKWGRHYFPSLARAHQMQRCNNFKDPGLQVYGQQSPLFTQSRDFADAEFDKLPPPTPSAPPTISGHRYGYWSGPSGSTHAKSAAPARTKISSMSRYNARGGVCFTGDCLVTLVDGTTARIDTLRRGSAVTTATGVAEVSAIVKTVIACGKTPLCRIGEVTVTPWHPVFHDGKWKFPSDVVEPEVQRCEAVYSVLLLPSPAVDDHTVFVGGMKVVTLGHGLVDDAEKERGGDVRNHSFFGRYEAVFDAVMRLKGFYEDGVCECTGVVRDAETGLIKGFTAAAEEADSMVDAGVAHAVRVGA